MVYRYKATRYKIPAQVAGEYLEGLSQEDDGLTKKKLLERSRPEDALLHDVFEWDDSIAAEKHRLWQAGYFISNIMTVEVRGEQIKPQRAIVSVTDSSHAERAVYKPVHVALADVDSREIVLRNAIREMESFKEKYQNLTELANVIGAIDEYLQETA